MTALGPAALALAVGQTDHASWLGFVVAAVPVCACLGLGVWLIVATGREDSDEDGGDNGDGEGGGGGGGRRGPRHPEPGPSLPDDDPEWWPQFERDFADYLQARRDTTRFISTRS
jgi:hypothetical protein